MSARIGTVLAGIVIPTQIPQRIGISGWARTMGDRIEKADGIVVLQEEHNPKISLQAAQCLQQATNKPAYVRLTVGQMNSDELKRVLEQAQQMQIAGIFMSQGYEADDNPLRLSVAKALSIFTKMYPQNSEKPLLACPAPLPTPYRTQEEALEKLQERVEHGPAQLFIPSWQDPLSTVCFLEVFAESKRPLPPVVQTICPLQTAKQFKEISALHTPMSPAHRSHEDLSVKQEVASLQAFASLTSEKVAVVATYANLTLAGDDNIEAVIAQVKSLSVTESKV